MLEVAIQQNLGTIQLDVAFRAPSGVTAVFGASGAGKTSLLRAVAGLAAGASGVVRVGDIVLQDAQSSLAPSKRRVGYVFQDARLFPHMRVDDNLTYGGTHDRDLVIDMLGLEPLLHRRPQNLSGGEAQRVAIGRALMSNPAILLLDEPLASLDAPRKAEIMPYLERLRDQTDIPILFVSHDLNDVARLATTLVILAAGHVVNAGPIEDLLSDPALVHHFGAHAAGSVVLATVASYDNASDVTTLMLTDGPIMVPGPTGPVGSRVRLRIPAQDIIISRNSPAGLSALNVLPVTIASIDDGENGGADVVLNFGRDRLLARITRRSVGTLGLVPGQAVHAIIKATAIVSHRTD